jgi:hypothetical protein
MNKAITTIERTAFVTDIVPQPERPTGSVATHTRPNNFGGWRKKNCGSNQEIVPILDPVLD